jgi:hypothetical protein
MRAEIELRPGTAFDDDMSRLSAKIRPTKNKKTTN